MSDPYYKDDLVTLFHGDCLEVAEWLTADVLVTDPPYGMGYTARGAYNPRTGRTAAPIGEEHIKGDLTTEVRDAVLAAWGTNKPAAVFGTWRQPRPEGTRHRLIWWKQGQAPGPLRAPFMSQDEEIYILGNGFRPSSPPLRSVITTQEARSVEVNRIGHPTPKPIGLMEILLDRCPAGVVADPFAGSGSTLIAARNLGRQSIGVELEERYCELIAKRLSQQAFDFGSLEDEVRASGWANV